MSDKHLGLPLDIHGGGQDLIFPHHENEIAQSEAATGKELARFWVHNGFVQVNAEKMSKSLGNFSTIRDILADYLPETLRFFLLTKHYRSPVDFTPENMEEAEKNLRRIYSAKADMAAAVAGTKWSKSPFPQELLDELAAAEADWAKAMDDDLNTAAALGHVFTLVRLAGRVAEDKALRKAEAARDLWTCCLHDLNKWGTVLGLFSADPAAFLAQLKAVRATRKGIEPAKVESLLQARQEARKAKDFAKSDALRDELLGMGVEVKDTPTGPAWDVA